MNNLNTHNIGILYEDDADKGLAHDFFAAIIEGFKRTVESRGYNITFLNTSKYYPDRKTFLQQVREEGYSGVFVPCIHYEEPEVIELFESEIPVTTIDYSSEGVISIESDNKGGMTKLVEYIISMNHRAIAYITGEDCLVTRTRLSAFLECTKKSGIEIPAEFIKQGRYRDMNMATFLTEELMRLPETPSCIIYPDDYSAVGGLNVLRARGFEIPSDISVAGFDGNAIMAHYEPRITTVFQDKTGMGKAAAMYLMEWIENPGYKPERSVIVDTNFQKGRSIGKVYY